TRRCLFLPTSYSCGCNPAKLSNVNSNPEVTYTTQAREDECLVLASDGLRDVMSNEEVCEVARKQILIWHKKNGGNVTDKGNGNRVDHAAQAAADD
ncbi:protein phosphatase 2C, partial [Tanacetum coccineum]